MRGFAVDDLEGPDHLRRKEDEPVETAPAEDFIAAGLVLLAFVLIVAAVLVASPTILTIGMATFALTGIGFGLVKLRKFLKTGRTRREGSFDETPSMFDWLIGRGFWDRFR